MSGEATERWSISTNEETYSCEFATREQAIEEGRAWNCGTFWVGRCEEPTAPEWFWCADNWIDHVLCQDEYSNDWAEGSLDASPEQLKELEAEVRPVLAAWLERHKLRPTFFMIDQTTVERIEPEDDPDAIGGPGYGGNYYPGE